jgi:hypothetical protein
MYLAIPMGQCLVLLGAALGASLGIHQQGCRLVGDEDGALLGAEDVLEDGLLDGTSIFFIIV